MNKAVFLDRDGVINDPVLNPETGEYESPHSPGDFRMYEWTLESLKKLRKAGFYLFLVSNQPSYAKGKTSLENIKAIHEIMNKELESNGVYFKEFYYCYHHPDGIIKDLSFKCECRKPQPFFLLKAQRDFDIDMDSSWMVGDRDTDIICGQSAGVKTILVKDRYSDKNQGKSSPDFFSENLYEAVKIITGEKR